MTRTRWLVPAAFALAAFPAAALAHGDFAPKKQKGTWSGTWHNDTFGSGGTASVNVKAPKNKKLVISTDLGGNIYGCADPGPIKFTLTKGRGANRWTKKGWHVVKQTDALGKLDITYRQKTHKMTGTGSDPACLPGLKWSLSGKWDERRLTGTVKITLPGGQQAQSRFAMDRQ